MLELAIGALVIGIIAWVLGFTGIAGISFAVAKIIAAIFLVIFLILLVAVFLIV